MHLNSSLKILAEAGFFSSTVFQWVLLIGCGLLAIGLLVMTLTRWGQAKPISKCVVLSVVAHLLLIGYMYGTQLISRAPKLRQTTMISMSLDHVEPEVPEEEIPEEEKAPEIVEDEPEESFAEHEFEPELEPLERPELDTEVEVESEFAQELGQAFENATLKAQQSPFQARAANISSTGIPAMPAVDSQTVEPEVIDFNRRQQEDSDLEDVPMLDEGGDFEVPRVEPELKNIDINPPEFESPSEPVEAFTPVESDSFEPITETDIAEIPMEAPMVEASPETEMVPVSRMTRPSDGQPLPQIYSLRNERRSETAELRGGNAQTERAVSDALAWLASVQSEDGRWDADMHSAGLETRALGHNRNGAGANADTGVTGLALLAFMAAGNTHYEGQYRKNVQYGLEFLLRNQKQNGQLDGDAKLFARMYCHSMALLAISEALAVTGDERLRAAVEKGVEFTVRAQNSSDGGWRYQPGDGGDMSQFGWKVLAMHSASLGGVVIPEKTMAGMRHFLDTCTSGSANGLGSYRPGQPASETMTAEALVCRFYLDKSVDTATIDEAVEKVFSKLPNDREINLYYWYYGTMAMYHTGGTGWMQWNEALQSVLLDRQIQSGQFRGSWAPDGVWGGYGGRVYSTAIATLCLEVYYRYLPIYEARLR